MQQSFKFFKWWFIKDIIDYRKLLEEKTATLIAMTGEEELIQKVVPLEIAEDGIVVADLGPVTGKYYLTPNQMVSRETQLKRFWLTDTRGNLDTPLILGTISAIEDGRTVMLPKNELRLYGTPIRKNVTCANYPISAIIPLGDGQYLIWEERNIATLVNDRETNETFIKIMMKRVS